MPFFRIHVLNVGLGDSIILELPDNNWGVVDCCRTSGQIEPPALTFLKDKERNIEKLKFVCLTHPHSDHFHGMLDILEYFGAEKRGIEYFWGFGIGKKELKYFKSQFGSEKEYKELRDLYDFIIEKVTEDKRIKYRMLGEGTDCLNIGSVKIKSYAPISGDVLEYFEKWGKDKITTKDENLLSVVLVITFGDTNVVLGADTISWEEILKAWSEDCEHEKRKPQFHFVKVSHHGSKDGNHAGLWKSFTEGEKSVAVISANAKPGIPHRETIVSIISSKTKLYSTGIPYFSELITRSLLEGLEASTLAVEVIPPYHGNCSVTVKDNGECLILPQIDRPPITSIP